MFSGDARWGSQVTENRIKSKSPISESRKDPVVGDGELKDKQFGAGLWNSLYWSQPGHNDLGSLATLGL